MHTQCSMEWMASAQEVDQIAASSFFTAPELSPAGADLQIAELEHAVNSGNAEGAPHDGLSPFKGDSSHICGIAGCSGASHRESIGLLHTVDSDLTHRVVDTDAARWPFSNRYIPKVHGSISSRFSSPNSAPHTNMWSHEKPLVAPTLSRPGHTTSPPLHVLQSMSAQELSGVENFSLSSHGVGSITWAGAVDLRSCNLDDVQLGPDEFSLQSGAQALDGPCVVVLVNVHPPDDQKIAPDAYFKEQVEEIGAVFIGYNCQARLLHFQISGF